MKTNAVEVGESDDGVGRELFGVIELKDLEFPPLLRVYHSMVRAQELQVL